MCVGAHCTNDRPTAPPFDHTAAPFVHTCVWAPFDHTTAPFVHVCVCVPPFSTHVCVKAHTCAPCSDLEHPLSPPIPLTEIVASLPTTLNVTAAITAVKTTFTTDEILTAVVSAVTVLANVFGNISDVIIQTIMFVTFLIGEAASVLATRVWRT